MSDKVKGFVVTLDADVSNEAVERFVAAIKMLRHVIDVRPIAAGYEDEMARERVRSDVETKLHKAIREALS